MVDLIEDDPTRHAAAQSAMSLMRAREAALRAAETASDEDEAEELDGAQPSAVLLDNLPDGVSPLPFSNCSLLATLALTILAEKHRQISEIPPVVQLLPRCAE